MEMIESLKFLVRINWPTIRAHVTTLAVAFGTNSTWKVPRDASRFGGVTYGLLFTVAMVTVGLPSSLMQFAVGQLSQQDAVGVWRAVPVLRGVGYLRLTTSFLMSTATIVYVGLTTTHFLYTINNGNPFSECYQLTEIVFIPDVNDTLTKSNSTCFTENFITTFRDVPEYYIALSLIIVVIGVAFPFLLYSPIKLMKNFFYVLGPLVFLLIIIISSYLGNTTDFYAIYNETDWQMFVQPDIWFRAVSQALMTSQVAGGYLVSSADSIYYRTNVQWTSLIFIGINILASWLSIFAWTSISGSTEPSDTPIAVLVQTYIMSAEKQINKRWTVLIFAMLLSSGIITMFTLLYPVYEHLRRVGGYKWRTMSFTSSFLAAAAALGMLAGGLPTLTMLEDYSLPLLVCVTSVLEVLGFAFVYGAKTLREDIEFLIGSHLSKLWSISWYLVPVFILSPTIWWVSIQFMGPSWSEPPWGPGAVVAALGLVIIVLLVMAITAVVQQDQYDLCTKLKSSVKPSRHWGPRDPITHYYWLASRDVANTDNVPATRYQRRQLGELPSSTIISAHTNTIEESNNKDVKRANSDDLVYTIYRREYLKKTFDYLGEINKRSKSLDWDVINNVKWKKRDSIVSIVGSNTEYGSMGSIEDYIAIISQEFSKNKVPNV